MSTKVFLFTDNMLEDDLRKFVNLHGQCLNADEALLIWNFLNNDSSFPLFYDVKNKKENE